MTVYEINRHRLNEGEFHVVFDKLNNYLDTNDDYTI